MEISFLELKEKEVINVFNGQKLGGVIDFVFELPSGRLLGLVVPGDKKLFKRGDDIFVPLEKVKRIGTDVVLVGLQNEVPIVSSKTKRQSQKKYYEKNYANRLDNFENSYNVPMNRNSKQVYAGQTKAYYNIGSGAANETEKTKTNSQSTNEAISFVRLKPLSSKKYK